jgi:hypothetical protein
MDLFDTLTWAKILVKTTILGTPTLTVPNWYGGSIKGNYLNGFEMYIFSKKIIGKNYFMMLYALYNKVHNFGTCKLHGTRIINCLFIKLIILCKPLLNVSHIQKRYQNDIIW